MVSADPTYPGELDRFTAGDVESLVHFLDDDYLIPYYEEHRESSACVGEDCPLCRGGDKPEIYSVLNVVVIAQSRGPKFSPAAIQLDGPLAAPFRRPMLKLWFAPVDYGVKIYEAMRKLEEWKPPRKINDPDVYFWITKFGVIPMTADDLTEEFHTRPLTWAERHEFSLAKWTSEWVRAKPGAKLRKVLRRPDP